MARRNIAEGLTDAVNSILSGFLTGRRIKAANAAEARESANFERQEAERKLKAEDAARPESQLTKQMEDLHASKDAMAAVQMAFADAGGDPSAAMKFLESQLGGGSDSQETMDFEAGVSTDASPSSTSKSLGSRDLSLRQGMLALQRLMANGALPAGGNPGSTPPGWYPQHGRPMAPGFSSPPMGEPSYGDGWGAGMMNAMTPGPSMGPMMPGQAVRVPSQSMGPAPGSVGAPPQPPASVSPGTYGTVDQILKVMMMLNDPNMSPQQRRAAILAVQGSIPVGGHSQATR